MPNVIWNGSDQIIRPSNMLFGLTQPITKYNTLDWSGANNTETLFNTDCYLPILNTLARTLHDNNVKLFTAQPEITFVIRPAKRGRITNVISARP